MTSNAHPELIQLTQLYTVNTITQVIPVIQYEEGDELTHSDEHPNCEDDTCPCNVNVVADALTASLYTYHEEV